MKIIIFALIPLILSIGITPILPFSYSEELICASGEVDVIRVTNPNPVCIDQSTAKRWSELGIAEIIGKSIIVVEEVMEEPSSEINIPPYPDQP